MGVFIFGSDKGGVGKTLASQAAITALAAANNALPIIIEVEAEPRLGPIYGAKSVHSFTLGANALEAIERNPRLIYATWNDVGEILLDAGSRDVVIDLGANLTRALMTWLNEFGEDGPLGVGGAVRFHAVTTGEAAAMVSASNALGYAKQSLPASKRILLVNERDENLFPMALDAAGVKSVTKAHDATAARFPRCMSPALSAIVDERMRLDEALTQTVDFWTKRGMPRMDAILAVRRLASWADAAMGIFAPVPA